MTRRLQLPGSELRERQVVRRPNYSFPNLKRHHYSSTMHHSLQVTKATPNGPRYVIKRGHTTLSTTIGCLTGFDSHVRRYFALGSRDLDLVKATVYPYHNDSGPCSGSGDCGSIIVDALGKFVALTSGAGPTGSSDITFSSPMHWLWEIIKAEFPGANLYFENDDN